MLVKPLPRSRAVNLPRALTQACFRGGALPLDCFAALAMMAPEACRPPQASSSAQRVSGSQRSQHCWRRQCVFIAPRRPWQRLAIAGKTPWQQHIPRTSNAARRARSSPRPAALRSAPHAAAFSSSVQPLFVQPQVHLVGGEPHAGSKARRGTPRRRRAGIRSRGGGRPRARWVRRERTVRCSRRPTLRDGGP